MHDFFITQIEDSILVKKKILEDNQFLEKILIISNLVINSIKTNNKVIIAGNGGSAADSQHIAGEFVSRFYFDRPALPALALTTDTSILTAIGNDYGYEKIFSRQLEATGNANDIFLAISTSGNSQNIMEALKVCKTKKILSIGLTGNSGGKMRNHCDYLLNVPSEETPRIQESHILIGHLICSYVEKNLFGD